MQSLRSVVDRLRDTYAPLTNTSTFRQTGSITPEEFVQAGDFLVYKFPSWSWADASTPAQRVSYFPPGKQYLVTRGVPCRRRLDENFAGDAGAEDMMVAGVDGADDGWLRTGGGNAEGDARKAGNVGEVRAVDDAGEVGEKMEDEDDIPDMEDEDDDEEAIIRDPTGSGGSAPLRTYTLYITYTPYYRTPRLYLSGYQSLTPSAPPTPLPPTAMMEDIVGDYKDKTVTLEDFPFISPPIKTASVHPCRHASVMKVLLDRADAALKLRTAKLKQGIEVPTQGMEGLVDQTSHLTVSQPANSSNKTKAAEGGKDQGDEWEVLGEGGGEEDEVAIRVDQYLVVFLKFMASVTPGIEHDYTMGV